jgi:phenylacetate-CoA ligase
MTKAVVGGGALPPSLRQLIRDEFGVTPLQNYGTADLGIIAYESPAMEGMLIGEGAIVEIVRPGSGDPVADGEVGEVAVTILNDDYPLTRFATGDLSAIMPGQSPCGRTAQRIKGWMGRADQTAKVRGMFVRPTQMEQIRAAHGEILKLRLVVTSVDHRDQFSVACETETQDPALAEKIAETVRKIINLSAPIELVTPGSLPSDGKVIEDARSYE